MENYHMSFSMYPSWLIQAVKDDFGDTITKIMD